MMDAMTDPVSYQFRTGKHRCHCVLAFITPRDRRIHHLSTLVPIHLFSLCKTQNVPKLLLFPDVTSTLIEFSLQKFWLLIWPKS